MFGSGWRIGRIAGIEIRIDNSWVIIALLVTFSVYTQFLRRLGETPALTLVLAIGASLLFFLSLLGHEMAHALVSRARGIPVKGITLFLFGGATHAKVESRGPMDELVISIVGPLTSFALAGAFLFLSAVGSDALSPSVTEAFRYLGLINLLLAIFNLLPGFPLDGGRVLRSIVWRATGSLRRATRVAGVSGQAVGYLIVATGAFLALTDNPFGGLWMAAVGWFLAQAARASARQLEFQQLLGSIEAEELMTGDLIDIDGALTVREAVDGFFVKYDHGAFPVRENGRTTGLATLRGIKRIPRAEWDLRRVREVIEPLGDQCTVDASDRMDEVLDTLQENDARRCLVKRDGEVVGIITTTDITRWLERRRALQG